MKKAVKVLAVVLVLIILIGLSSCFVVTHQNEYTIIRQFGKVVDIRDTAGISFKLPIVQDTQTLPNTVLLYDLPVSDESPRIKRPWWRIPSSCGASQIPRSSSRP